MKLYTLGLSVITQSDNITVKSVEWVVCHSKIQFSETMNEWTSEKILVYIDPDNALLSDTTKTLPEPKLTYHKWGLASFTWSQFKIKFLRYISR